MVPLMPSRLRLSQVSNSPPSSGSRRLKRSDPGLTGEFPGQRLRFLLQAQGQAREQLAVLEAQADVLRDEIIEIGQGKSLDAGLGFERQRRMGRGSLNLHGAVAADPGTERKRTFARLRIADRFGMKSKNRDFNTWLAR